MKKYIAFFLIILSAALAACGDANSNKTNAGADSAETALSKNPDYQKGLTLVAKNDCLTCHQITGQATGPAYQDVANKYSDDSATIDKLAHKIISGGSGNWGAVPMVPHPDLSLDDAKAIVKYILLLKTK